MKTSKLRVPSVLPYKLIRFSPKIESQILVTTRKEKIVKLPYINKRECFPESLTEDVGKIFDQFQHTFTTVASEASNNNMTQENIQRLNRLSHSSPVIGGALNKPQNSLTVLPKISQGPQHRDSHVRTIITVEDNEEPQENDNSFFHQRKHFKQFEHVFWLARRRTGHVACARESSQIAILADSLYLYGGQSRVKHREISVLNLRSFEWKILDSKNTPPGRLGHSLVVFNRCLLVYGGWVVDKLNPNLARCSKSLYSFDTVTYNWKKVTHNGKVPAGRRHHAAVSVGKDMIVYGGINNNGERLNELIVFDTSDLSWRCPAVEYKDDPGKRSHFSFTPVFHPNLFKETSNSLEGLSQSKWLHLLKNSGFYLFGGLDNDGQPSNDMYVLCIHRKKLRWVFIEASGVPPPKRYAHSSSCIKSTLFVFGGRNDMINIDGFSDLHIFNIENLKWESVEAYGNLPGGRWGHCMSSYGNRILVLGGMNSSQFMSSDVYELETDAEYVEELIENTGNK